MKIGLPIELLSFEWMRRLQAEIKRLMPEVEIVHSAPHKAGERHVIPLSEGDACFPFKKMIRTAMALLPVVDRLLVPRLVRLDGHLLCPNFRAFPDLVVLNRDRLAGPEKNTPLVDTVVDITSTHDEEQVLAQLMTGLFADQAPVGAVLGAPDSAEAKAERLTAKLTGHKRYIALIGRAYMLQDAQLNMGIASILSDKGFGVITPQDVAFTTLDQAATSKDYYAKTMYWRGARECLGAFMHITDNFTPAGIIYVLSFNCGVDALVRIELASLHKKLDKKIPMMVLVGDEHSQREHVVTRLEAFLDVIDGITT